LVAAKFEPNALVATCGNLLHAKAKSGRSSLPNP
jgi:hypothetical protein